MREQFYSVLGKGLWQRIEKEGFDYAKIRQICSSTAREFDLTVPKAEVKPEPEQEQEEEAAAETETEAQHQLRN